MEKIEVHLDSYNGPLDLLLHLIKTLEVDIYDIPIAEITKQYMAVIEAMKELELEIAGEYIVMASTLMAIKSKMLLPIETYEGEESLYDEEEGTADPRQQLVEQLIEYKKYKNIADILQEKGNERRDYFTKEMSALAEFQTEEILLDPRYNTIDLFLGFHQMLEKRKLKEPLQTAIKSEEISIEKRMDEILVRLANVAQQLTGQKQGILFDEMFEEEATKIEIITTFMAILELMKKHQISIKQEATFGQIFLHPNFKES